MLELVTKCPICENTNFRTILSCKDYLTSGEIFQIQQCTDCGLKITNPRPNEDNIGKYYKSEDYISHSGSSKGLVNTLYLIFRKYTVLRKARLIENYINEGKILDIGCGTGQFLAQMKKKKWEVIGVEPDEETREFGSKMYSIDVRKIEELGYFEDKEFDVITMWHVLEHVNDIEKRLQTVFKLLKEKGIVIVAIPNSECFDAKVYDKYWAGFDLPRHLWHFSIVNISRLFNNMNFLVIKSIPMKFDSFYISLLSEKNKTGKTNWMRGLYNGLISNLIYGKKLGYSSNIFILIKKV